METSYWSHACTSKSASIARADIVERAETFDLILNEYPIYATLIFNLYIVHFVHVH